MPTYRLLLTPSATDCQRIANSPIFISEQCDGCGPGNSGNNGSPTPAAVETVHWMLKPQFGPALMTVFDDDAAADAALHGDLGDLAAGSLAVALDAHAKRFHVVAVYGSQPANITEAGTDDCGGCPPDKPSLSAVWVNPQRAAAPSTFAQGSANLWALALRFCTAADADAWVDGPAGQRYLAGSAFVRVSLPEPAQA
jgi:hypothetical protein